MADLEALISTYEDAVAAVQEDPDDDAKRAAMTKAGQRLADARQQSRAGRPFGVVADGSGE